MNPALNREASEARTAELRRRAGRDAIALADLSAAHPRRPLPAARRALTDLGGLLLALAAAARVAPAASATPAPPKPPGQPAICAAHGDSAGAPAVGRPGEPGRHDHPIGRRHPDHPVAALHLAQAPITAPPPGPAMHQPAPPARPIDRDHTGAGVRPMTPRC